MRRKPLTIASLLAMVVSVSIVRMPGAFQGLGGARSDTCSLTGEEFPAQHLVPLFATALPSLLNERARLASAPEERRFWQALHIWACWREFKGAHEEEERLSEECKTHGESLSERDEFSCRKGERGSPRRRAWLSLKQTSFSGRRSWSS